MELIKGQNNVKGDGPPGADAPGKEPPYVDAIRRRLLVHIHIAKRDLGMTDEHYRILLEALFGKSTAAALPIEELNHLVNYFKGLGWQPILVDFKIKAQQLASLRKRSLDLAKQLPNGEKRLQGLCKKMCGVENVEWCKDYDKLRKLLAAMGNIVRLEGEKQVAQ